MQEYEVIFEDGYAYCVEAETEFDAKCEAESEYLYDHEPLKGFAHPNMVESFELPKIKSCVAI